MATTNATSTPETNNYDYDHDYKNSMIRRLMKENSELKRKLSMIWDIAAAADSK